MKVATHPILPCLARKGMLGVGIPASRGGSGGDLDDLFDVVARTARRSLAEARILAVQRHFAEVLLTCENVALAEHRLGYILDGSISGACTVTWPERVAPPLAGREVGTAWRVSGALPPVPNVGADWYLVTALLQRDAGRAPFLVLLSSEQDGLLRRPAPSPEAVEGDDTAALFANRVFFRADEILHEDATQVCGRLVRFAQFLREAIDAGRAHSAIERPRRHVLPRTINS